VKSFVQKLIGNAPGWTRIRYARKIAKVRREAGLKGSPLSGATERQAIEIWKRHGFRLNLAWHRSYASISPSRQAHLYIPEDLYYAYIEPKFVRYELADAYADKNNYDRLLPDVPTLPVIARRMNGRYYDRNYIPISDSAASSIIHSQLGYLIIKPSIQSGDGINVRKALVDGGELWLEGQKIEWQCLEAVYGMDFIVQPCFRQHPAIAEFHPNSVNTIRFLTYRLNDEVRVASAVLRLGNAGRHVDNRGIPCGIKPSGELNDEARTKYFQKFIVHPVTGKPFKGFVIPGFDAARDRVCHAHNQLPYFDAVSWDIAIGADGLPRIVELNLTFQEINFHQVNNGPLFGEQTEEVLDHVFTPAKRVALAAPTTGNLPDTHPAGVATQQI